MNNYSQVVNALSQRKSSTSIGGGISVHFMYRRGRAPGPSGPYAYLVKEGSPGITLPVSALLNFLREAEEVQGEVSLAPYGGMKYTTEGYSVIKCF